MDEVKLLMITVSYKPQMAHKREMNKNIDRTNTLDLKGRKVSYVNGVEKE